MRGNQPPLDFFLSCSDIGLESYQLSRLERAACLRKELQQVASEWIDAEVNARLARVLLDERQREVATGPDGSAVLEPRAALAFPTVSGFAQGDALPKRLAGAPASGPEPARPADSANTVQQRLLLNGAAAAALRQLLRVPAPAARRQPEAVCTRATRGLRVSTTRTA
jgi:hypothetical protein